MNGRVVLAAFVASFVCGTPLIAASSYPMIMGVKPVAIQVGTTAEIGVRDRHIVAEHLDAGGLGGESRKGRRPDKARGARGEDRHDVRTGIDQAPAELDRLVGGDAARHAEHDGRSGKRQGTRQAAYWARTGSGVTHDDGLAPFRAF